MTESVAARILALGVFIALVAGSVWAVDRAIETQPVVFRAVEAHAVESQRNATAGNLVSFYLTLANRGETDERLTVDVAPPSSWLVVESFISVPEGSVEAPAGNTTGTILTLRIPNGTAPGNYAFHARVAGSERGLRSASVPLSVTVLGGGPGAAREHDRALVDYVGWTEDGRLFDTSRADILATPEIPRSPLFRDHAPAPLPIDVGPGSRIIEGFWTGLLGMLPGESRTLVLPPEVAYGNATAVVDEPRTTVLGRTIEWDRVYHGTVQTFADVVNETTVAGDTVYLSDENNRWPLYVEAIEAENVTLRLEVALGDSYVVRPPACPAWAAPVRVAGVDEDDVRLEFVPPPPDATFTCFAHWPDASRVLRADPVEVVVQHSPAVGSTYEKAVGPNQRQTARVIELLPDAVRVEAENPNPLAGHTLYFDVTVIETAPPDEG